MTNITSVMTKATKLVVKVAGDKKIELFASRSASSWAHDYIRYADDPKVYITGNKIIYGFFRKSKFLAEVMLIICN